MKQREAAWNNELHVLHLSSFLDNYSIFPNNEFHEFRELEEYNKEQQIKRIHELEEYNKEQRNPCFCGFPQFLRDLSKVWRA